MPLMYRCLLMNVHECRTRGMNTFHLATVASYSLTLSKSIEEYSLPVASAALTLTSHQWRITRELEARTSTRISHHGLQLIHATFENLINMHPCSLQSFKAHSFFLPFNFRIDCKVFRQWTNPVYQHLRRQSRL